MIVFSVVAGEIREVQRQLLHQNFLTRTWQ